MPAEAARRDRIVAALKRTLEEQLTEVPGSTHRWMTGPWRNVFQQDSEWPRDLQLDRQLFGELRNRFNAIVTREILFAAADIKISRVTLKQADVDQMHDIAGRFGFELAVSDVECVPIVDCGKGRWANRGRAAARPGEKSAARNVYVASNRALADTGRMLDEAGEDDLFGSLLGIPTCCRRAYEVFRPLAAQRQNDLLPLVLDSTIGPTPYDWRLNYASQYFGASLLSFSPCSFTCIAALGVAETTLRMLACCDAAWAGEFVKLQRANVIYTENSGVHLIFAPLVGDRIVYNARDLSSTQDSWVSALLRQGDTVKVGDKHTVAVYRGPSAVGQLAGPDINVGIFH